jgi:outer membrane biosynthesis protein TonB
MRVSGDVVVKITIDDKGILISAKAICGHPLKRSFAMSAVRKWKFRPDKLNGKVKKASGIVYVRFPSDETG